MRRSQTDSARALSAHGAAGDRSAAPAPTAPAVTHYENFPVATWLCPRPLRPAVAAIYHFARTADDLADEGDASAGERLEQLRRYRRALHAACAASAYPATAPWAPVMQPLQTAIGRHRLPVPALHDLLTAFERDVHHTASNQVYATHEDLLDYARYSANPVGRLMLHLYGVTDAGAIRDSDAICTALQLFNFWQDLSVDVARRRYYLPADLCGRYGVDPRRPHLAPPAACTALMAELVSRAENLMQSGTSLPRTVAQHAGWMAGAELRLVIQGGRRIGAKTRALGARIALQRPVIGARDGLAMLAATLLRH